jgi:hypothetical protein
VPSFGIAAEEQHIRLPEQGAGEDGVRADGPGVAVLGRVLAGLTGEDQAGPAAAGFPAGAPGDRLSPAEPVDGPVPEGFPPPQRAPAPVITPPASPPPARPAPGGPWPPDELSPDQARTAVRALGQCRLAEGRSVFGSYGDSGLTPAMRAIEDRLSGGELLPDTEKYALKSLGRFQAKLARLVAEEPAASPDDLARQIHDSIRYTFWYAPDHYTDGVLATQAELAAAGYELQLLHNGWDSETGPGISSRWRDPASGQDFEILFHTPDSWQARQLAHPHYDQIASPLTSPGDKERLRGQVGDVYREVPRPDRCLDLPGDPRDPLPSAPLAWYSISRGPASRPASGLLRRRLTSTGRVDESLRRDLSWRPSAALFEWETGDVSSRRIALVSSAEADRLTARFTSEWAGPG